jgi:hypothetical protein
MQMPSCFLFITVGVATKQFLFCTDNIILITTHINELCGLHYLKKKSNYSLSIPSMYVN